MYVDEDFGTLMIDENELHDIIVALPYLYNEERVVEQVKIVPIKPDKFDKALVTKWEGLMNGLLASMRQLDAEAHEDIDCTC